MLFWYPLNGLLCHTSEGNITLKDKLMMVLRSILFFFMTIGLGCGFCNPLYSQVQNNNSITIWIMYDKNATRAIDKVIRLYKTKVMKLILGTG